MTDRAKVLNVITKLSVGGAQETALRYCSLLDPARWDTALVAGPESSPEGDLFEEAARLHVRRLTIPTLARRLRPLADLRAVVDLFRLFRRERPDIVHTHSSKAGLVGRLAARLAGVPVVLHTVHGWSFQGGMSPAGRRMTIACERLAAKWTTALVVVAARDAEVGLAARIGRPDQYALVRSAIDVDRLRRTAGSRAEARLAFGIPDGAPVVGTVTRLCRQKDPETLLRAHRRVVDHRPDAHLVVVGDGPLRAEVEAMVDDLRLRPHVTLLGPRSDVAALLPGFDVFVLSSRWEGLPRVIVEAMAAGVPVVSTEVGGISEAIEDQESGLLAPAGDAAALGDAAVRVLDDPSLAARLRRAAQVDVEEFDVGVMVDRLDDLYSTLLTGGRSRPRRRRMVAAVRTESGHEAA
ncbi:MAG TPA: glycosyltransferase family 4 protein [Acidimicrobiales bacterium]|nr:glycosyltransferase family 4 protein [Acidimicrobiales bacterium]